MTQGPSTPANPADAGGSRPTPDPTILTTDQLLREAGHLKELLTEKLIAVDKFLNKVEEQRVEQKIDTKTAVDAALAAQEKAILKTELATAEALRQLKLTFDTALIGVVSSIDDLKNRVGRVEGVKLGGQESKAGLYAAIAAAVGIVGLIVTLLVVGGP